MDGMNDTEQQEYEALMKEIAVLQGKADALRDGARARAQATIKKLMDTYGLSVDDLAPKQRKSAGPATVKYRHPVTGVTWTGRGRAPAWLATEEQREQCRV